MSVKKWKAYFFVYKIQIQKTLAYRFDVYSNILGQCIVMFATAFFWKALYAGYDTVKGVALDEMLTYTIISSAMAMLFLIQVENRVSDSVWKGTVATDMVKPINLFGIYLFEDLGHTTSILFQNVVPIILIGSIFSTVPTPASIHGVFDFILFHKLVTRSLFFDISICGDSNWSDASNKRTFNSSFVRKYHSNVVFPRRT